MALLNFDASKVAPSKALDPVPAGWYDAKIISSDLKPTANGSGTRLNLTFELIGGEFNGRKVFEGLNIKNSSEKAQQIAQEQLSAICHAVNIMNLVQSEALHGHPLKIKVKIKPADGTYDARNEISGYENINYKPATQGSAAKPAIAAPATAQRPAGPPQGGFGVGAQAAPQRPAQSQPNGFGTQGQVQHDPNAVAKASPHQGFGTQHHPNPQQEQPWEAQDVNQTVAVEQLVGVVAGSSQDAPWGQ